MVRARVESPIQEPAEPPLIEYTVRMAVAPENVEDVRAATAVFAENVGSFIVGNAEGVVVDTHIPEESRYPNPYKKHQDTLLELALERIHSHNLDPQEQDIAKLLVQNFNGVEISDQLRINPRYVNACIGRIQAKTKQSTRRELVAYLIGINIRGVDKKADTHDEYAQPRRVERPVLSTEQRSAIDTLTAQRMEYYGLSSREREVASFLLKGMSNLAIAEKLFVSEPTVKGYVGKVFERMGCNNRIGVVCRLLGVD